MFSHPFQKNKDDLVNKYDILISVLTSLKNKTINYKHINLLRLLIDRLNERINFIRNINFDHSSIYGCMPSNAVLETTFHELEIEYELFKRAFIHHKNFKKIAKTLVSDINKESKESKEKLTLPKEKEIKALYTIVHHEFVTMIGFVAEPPKQTSHLVSSAYQPKNRSLKKLTKDKLKKSRVKLGLSQPLPPTEYSNGPSHNASGIEKDVDTSTSSQTNISNHPYHYGGFENMYPPTTWFSVHLSKEMTDYEVRDFNLRIQELKYAYHLLLENVKDQCDESVDKTNLLKSIQEKQTMLEELLMNPDLSLLQILEQDFSPCKETFLALIERERCAQEKKYIEAGSSHLQLHHASGSTLFSSASQSSSGEKDKDKKDKDKGKEKDKDVTKLKKK